MLAIPLGEAVRNVLRSETFEVLRSTPNLKLVIASQAADDPEFRAEFGGANVEFETLRAYSPTFLERGLETFRLGMLHRHSNTIRLIARRGYGERLKLVVPFARLAGRLFGDRRMNALLGWANIRFVSSAGYDELFTRHRPNLVLVSRVLSFSADYLVLKGAVRRRIPVIALASSWDNFTSKGFFPFGIERIVVWNQIMRDEAAELFGIRDDRLVVAGIPRFDALFRRTGFRGHVEFFRSLGLDPSRPLLTYATGHARLGWPYQLETPEPRIVELLADARDRGALEGNPQILIRLHPQADPLDYARLAGRSGVTLYTPGRQSSFPDRDLSDRDNAILGETMLHSDVVMNIASTITIDAAVFDTPVVCVGIDVGAPRPPEESVARFYEFEHYRKLAECGGYRRADTVEALIDEVNAYLLDPARDREGREKIVRQQCVFTDGRAGQRVAAVILAELGILSDKESANVRYISSSIAETSVAFKEGSVTGQVLQ